MLFKVKYIWIYLTCLLFYCSAQNEIPNTDPLRFEKEIKTFEEWDQKNSFPENAILFVGSSSIRYWKTSDAFPEYKVINRGFGGSHISDVQFYYDKVIKKYAPKIIIFYAGDNDIAGGKSKETVFTDYRNLISQIYKDNPDVKFVYIPIKPSPSRWSYWPEMKALNNMIKTYNQKNENLFYIDLATPVLNDAGRPNNNLFRKDKLHLNEKGYAIWNTLLNPFLKNILSR